MSDHKDVESHNTTNAGANGAAGLQGGDNLSRQISVTLTQQQFEELYLSPAVRSRAQESNIKTFGNPTPLGVISFLLPFFSTSMCLLEFSGANANSLLVLLPVYYLVGGIGLILSGLLEWVLGNSFPCLVFTSFGMFWLSLGMSLDPNYAIATTLGAGTKVYNSAFSFYLIAWAIYCLILSVAALRTNAVFVWILFLVFLTFCMLASAYMAIGNGNMGRALNLLKAGGGCAFACCLGGYYLLAALTLGIVGFPVALPVFDLAHLMGKN